MIKILPHSFIQEESISILEPIEQTPGDGPVRWGRCESGEILYESQTILHCDVKLTSLTIMNTNFGLILKLNE